MKNFYKCSLCGKVVEVVALGEGSLNCCNKPMTKLNSNEVGVTEKHMPEVTVSELGVAVKISDVEHPMTNEHYIMWISLDVDGQNFRKYLKPGDKPEAFFDVKNVSKFTVSEYCNLHGLWSKEK